jgi:hypothetical protein
MSDQRLKNIRNSEPKVKTLEFSPDRNIKA